MEDHDKCLVLPPRTRTAPRIDRNERPGPKAHAPAQSTDRHVKSRYESWVPGGLDPLRRSGFGAPVQLDQRGQSDGSPASAGRGLRR